MNRRSFLSLALAGYTLSVVGCGKEQAAAASQVPSTGAPSSPSDASAASASPGAVLSAPPLSAKSSPINNGATSIPSRLEIPVIRVDIPVVELGWSVTEIAGKIFNEWDVAAYAAGWHKNSALPGAGGNVVMSGHNNILGAVFRELDQLKKDDAIMVWMGAQLYTYAVSQVVIIPDTDISEDQRAANARWIEPFNEERLTLVSCWPRNNNTHRIIVVAHPQVTAQVSR